MCSLTAYFTLELHTLAKDKTASSQFVAFPGEIGPELSSVRLALRLATRPAQILELVFYATLYAGSILKSCLQK